MTKLEFLKKMYLEGKTEGQYEDEKLTFESLEKVKEEIVATMKRMRELEDLEFAPMEDEDQNEQSKKMPKYKYYRFEFPRDFEKIFGDTWEIPRIRFPRYFL